MDEMTFVCQIIAALSAFRPDSEIAKLAIEFAQRPSKGDGDALWDDRENLVSKVQKAVGEFESSGLRSISDIEKTAEFVKNELSK